MVRSSWVHFSFGSCSCGQGCLADMEFPGIERGAAHQVHGPPSDCVAKWWTEADLSRVGKGIGQAGAHLAPLTVSVGLATQTGVDPKTRMLKRPAAL